MSSYVIKSFLYMVKCFVAYGIAGREILATAHHRNSLTTFVKSGDIHLGVIISIGRPSSSCRPNLESITEWNIMEAIVFAVNKINKNATILPGIKLGYAIVDSCSEMGTAVTNALRFRPPDLSSEVPTANDGFDVIGVISGEASGTTEYLNYLLSASHIPQVSLYATSDKLNSNDYFSYFLRVVPNNFFQMKAIVEFMARQGWSYFSILYSEGIYGETGFKGIKEHIRVHSMCIAYSQKLKYNFRVENYRLIVKKLMKKLKQARVVVLICFPEMAYHIFRVIREVGAQHMFIFICSDALHYMLRALEKIYRPIVLGSFTTGFYAPKIDEFERYRNSLKPSVSKNPWMIDVWEILFNCSFQKMTCDDSLSLTKRGLEIPYQVAYTIDAVNVYALSLDKMMREKCNDRVKSSAGCVKDFAQGLTRKCSSMPNGRIKCYEFDLMLPYLKSVFFQGHTGIVKFDEVGNRLGRFSISQIVQDITPGDRIYQKIVRIIDFSRPNTIVIEEVNSIIWDYFSPIKSKFGSDAILAKTGYQVKDENVPVSVCSRVCVKKESKVVKKKSCCWDCKPCIANEILVNNGTACQKCPEFYWPNASTNFTTCSHIKHTIPMDIISYVFVISILSGLGILLTIAIMIGYIVYRQERIIKASSRELSLLKLASMFIGFIGCAFQLLQPSKSTCVVSYFLVCLSYNGLYSCMLLKAIRVYRLFKFSLKGRRSITAIQPYFQILFVFASMLGQSVICCLVVVLTDFAPRLNHPIRSKEYVELNCKFGFEAIGPFIGSNIILIVLCSIFAVKTRKLPNNYNEFQSIVICVFMVILIWVGVVISITTFRSEIYKLLFFAAILELNLLIALICLHGNRMYLVIRGKHERQDHQYVTRTASPKNTEISDSSHETQSTKRH